VTIQIISIGKTNIPFVKEGIYVYLNRLKHYTKLEWIELPDVKNSKSLDKNGLRKKEGEVFMSRINGDDYVVLLDENGKLLNSVEFAEWLDQRTMYHIGNLVFIIGGAYGFSDEIYKRANASISLSKLTFNHQMVRMIFAEQLYRAFTIQRGESYHHF